MLMDGKPKEKGWELKVQKGRFDAIPAPFHWKNSVHFAHLLNAYDIIGPDAVGSLANQRLTAAEAGQGWQGTAAELWMCLFFEHRRWRHAGMDPSPEEQAALDSLCETLRQRLLNLGNTEHAELVGLLAAHPFPGVEDSINDD